MYIRKKYKGTPVDTDEEFICDTQADLASLPTDAKQGSSAFVIEDSTMWMINSSGQWIQTIIGGGGGGGGGGSDLPAVTSDDNGDVLTVVEGEWAKAASKIVIIPLEYDDVNDYSYFSKTYKEIHDLMSAGYLCVSLYTTLAGSAVCELIVQALYSIDRERYEVATLCAGFGQSGVGPSAAVYYTDNENGYPHEPVD